MLNKSHILLYISSFSKTHKLFSILNFKFPINKTAAMTLNICLISSSEKFVDLKQSITSL